MYRATIPPLKSIAEPEVLARASYARAAGVTHDVTRIDDALLKQALTEHRCRKAGLFGGSVTLEEYVNSKKRTFALMMEHVAHEYGYELRRRTDEPRAVIGSSSPPPSPVLVDAADAAEGADAVAEEVLERERQVSDDKHPDTDDGDDVTSRNTADAVSETPDDSEDAAEEQPTSPDSDGEGAVSEEQTDGAEEQTAEAPASADAVPQDTTPADSDAAESEED